MLKIHTNVSKKVPIPGQDYSSQQYMAGMEVEISDGATAEQIQTRIAEVYELLERTIDDEIAKQQPEPTPVAASQPANRLPQCNGGNGGNGGHTPGNGKNGNGHATTAQVKAIFAISKAVGMTRDELFGLVWSEFNAEKVEALSVRQASTLIESLKARQDA